MPRRLRIQFKGARYHVINRGNLQHDVFATPGAIHSFTRTLATAVHRFHWRLHAYAVMRNHFHLALETPEPNLVEGMHWLQSTFAVRLTRFHRQHGHVFQGRYKSLLVEDAFHLSRVCDYIHLNPVRAGVVELADLGEFQASSLWYWLSGRFPSWLDGSELLRQAGLEGSDDPWRRYVAYLARIAALDRGDERSTPGAFAQGWAIGTSGWRKALAREYHQMSLAPEMSAPEILELKQARWQAALDAALEKQGRSRADLGRFPKGEPWKVEVARSLRASVAPSFAWIAAELNMGKPASVRVYLSRRN